MYYSINLPFCHFFHNIPFFLRFYKEDKLSKLNKDTTTWTWRTNLSIINQLQIKIVTRLTILGFRNKFGVSKVPQPPKIQSFCNEEHEFSMFIVKAPAS